MSKDLQPPNQSEEVDLGQLFKLIGSAFERLFNFIGSLFYKVFLSFVWTVFFVKKHILKIVIAGIIGFGYGFYKEKKGESIYQSVTLVKQNYNTGENLYSAVYYYNELIKERDTVTLGRILDIHSGKAASIVSLDVKADISINSKLIEYDLYTKKLDTARVSDMTFHDFIDNSKDYEYPNQRIIIKSKEKDVFIPLINNIVKKIKETDFFILEQKRDLEELSSLENTIIESIKESKDLQGVYKNVLITPLNTGNNSGQTRINIRNTDDKPKTKEFELYKSDLELRRELVEVRRNMRNKEIILEIISNQEHQGSIDNSKVLFGEMVEFKMYYVLIFGLIVIISLLGLRFIRFLEQYKDKV